MSDSKHSPQDEESSPSLPAPKPLAVRARTRLVPVVYGKDRDRGANQVNVLQFLLQVLRRWSLVTIPAGLILAAAGAAVVYLQFDPMYQAEGWIKIERLPMNIVFRLESDPFDSYVRTQIALLRSRMVLRDVVLQPEISGLSEFSEIRESEDRIAWLAKRLGVASVDQSEFFKITYPSHEPADAMAVVKAVIEEYFVKYDKEAGGRFNKVLDKLRDEARLKEASVQDLRKKVKNLAEADPGSQHTAKQIGEESIASRVSLAIQGQLVAAQVDRAVLEATIKVVEDETSALPGGMADGMVNNMVSQNEAIQQLALRIAEKKGRLRRMEGQLVQGARDPTFRRLADEIGRDEKALEGLRGELKPTMKSDLDKALVARRANELAGLNYEMRALQKREELLREQLADKWKEVQKASGDSWDMEFARQELEGAEQVLAKIRDRMLQLRTESSAPARVARALEPFLPVAPVERYPLRMMAMVAMAGLCLPLGLAAVWERIRRRVSDADNLERELTLSVMGEIAQLPLRARVSRVPSSSRLKRGMRLHEESIDALRTQLVLGEDLRDVKVLAVTSAARHEGKTTVAAQLAMSLAQSFLEPTLLVDGDVRCPEVHNIFDVPLEPGLAAVLAGECTAEEAVVQSWEQYLHVLPAGELKVNPHQLFGNGGLKSALAQLRPSYRYIVIDCPPVLPASEAVVLAKAADACLVCVLRDVTRMDQIKKTCSRLEGAGVRIAGAVFNGVPMKRYAYVYGDD